ncbi:hypothetical protein V6N12_048240 [Hibiscus sabdariffa]|uniref:Squalene monooxygenase n=1 Tax=Hibiscus sabdariffa TaxID=183260 RepID=A0ABR2EKF4_9ROSI
MVTFLSVMLMWPVSMRTKDRLLLTSQFQERTVGISSLNFLTVNSGCTRTKTASMEFPNENSVNRTANCEATDIIIVGAGVAGAALAYSLGKDGRRVSVIKMDLNEPRRIAGENLMPGGYLKLIELGLEGFHNGRFVQRLRSKAASLHNVSLEQGTVTSLLEENGTVKGVHYKDTSGRLQTAYAPLTVVCNGCFSNLRRALCDPKIEVPSYCVGFVLTNCKLPHENYGGLVIAHRSPFAFYPISSTEIRCLVDVRS